MEGLIHKRKKIHDLFLPIELAILAKEKGFNEPCMAYWDILGETAIFKWGVRNNEFTNIVAAPITQQIIDWFIEKHDIYPIIGGNAAGWYWEVSKQNGTTIVAQSDGNYYDTHYESLNEVMFAALKLI